LIAHLIAPTFPQDFQKIVEDSKEAVENGSTRAADTPFVVSRWLMWLCAGGSGKRLARDDFEDYR
jgi:hypothetical protein